MDELQALGSPHGICRRSTAEVEPRARSRDGHQVQVHRFVFVNGRDADQRPEIIAI